MIWVRSVGRKRWGRPHHHYHEWWVVREAGQCPEMKQWWCGPHAVVDEKVRGRGRPHHPHQGWWDVSGAGQWPEVKLWQCGQSMRRLARGVGAGAAPTTTTTSGGW